MTSEIRADIEDELVATEREIASLRIARDRVSYKLEQNLRERVRLYRHLSALNRVDSNPERRSA
jgi:hypothetical protein